MLKSIQKGPFIQSGMILTFLAFAFTGCDKDQSVAPEAEKGDEIVVDASSSTDWVYFSFSKGTVVEIENPSESANWDLGLRRYHFSTNSGTSGNAQGGALDMGDLTWNDVVEAPANGYVVDDSLAYEGHSGTEMYSVNPVLETWAERVGMPPTFVPSDHVFVVKTADGKFVKLWLKSYYNDEGTSGHITFQYDYEASGKRQFN